MKTALALTDVRTRVCGLLESRSVGVQVLLVVVGAYLTALAAQVKIPLPFTPVPVTAQVLVVLLIGGLLRPRLAFGAQAVFLLAGMAGLPWYAVGGGYPLGPTGGYILGFVLAAPMLSMLLRRYGLGRSLTGVVLAMAAAVTTIHLLGATHLALLTGAPIGATLAMAVAPFVAVDAVKIVLAAGVVRAVRLESR